jgi:hypothetical protein
MVMSPIDIDSPNMERCVFRARNFRATTAFVGESWLISLGPFPISVALQFQLNSHSRPHAHAHTYTHAPQIPALYARWKETSFVCGW